MLKGIIQYVVNCFPEIHIRGGCIHEGPCKVTDSEPSLEQVIARRKKAVLDNAEKEAKEITKKVVSASVRKELFANYGIDEKKEIAMFKERQRYCAPCGSRSNDSGVEHRLLNAILNDMTNQVMKTLND